MLNSSGGRSHDALDRRQPAQEEAARAPSPAGLGHGLGQVMSHSLLEKPNSRCADARTSSIGYRGPHEGAFGRLGSTLACCDVVGGNIGGRGWCELGALAWRAWTKRQEEARNNDGQLPVRSPDVSSLDRYPSSDIREPIFLGECVPVVLFFGLY